MTESPQQPRESSSDVAARDLEGSVTLYLGKLRQGDETAAKELWQHFFPRMQGLARKTLANWPQRIADADDAAQSAFISFWKKVQSGRLAELLTRDDVWHLLATITVRKALKQVERERTQKRGGGQTRGESEGPFGEASGQLPLDQAIGRLPTQEFDLRCEELLLQLDEEQRQIAVLRLMGHTNQEIADLLECTERKVQRKLHLIRLKWERDIEP